MTPISDNTALSRFEYEMDGQVAFADYKREGQALVILHVEAPMSLRGTGAAGKLMQGIAKKAVAESLHIVPVCSYAAAWLAKHSEYHVLLKR